MGIGTVQDKRVGRVLRQHHVGFCGDIGLERTVPVEMVVGEIGDDRNLGPKRTRDKVQLKT